MLRKKTDFFSNISQNENIFVEMGELFLIHFEKMSEKNIFFSKFSNDFCQCGE